MIASYQQIRRWSRIARQGVAALAFGSMATPLWSVQARADEPAAAEQADPAQHAPQDVQGERIEPLALPSPEAALLRSKLGTELRRDMQRAAGLPTEVTKGISKMLHARTIRDTASRACRLANNGYEQDVLTLDMVLATERSLADAELNYFGMLLQLSGEVSERDRQCLLATKQMQVAVEGRDNALKLWRRVKALYDAGAPRGDAADETQAREQYFFFRGRVERAAAAVLEAHGVGTRAK